MENQDSDELDLALSALDNTARRSMLQKLVSGPAMVGELNELFEMSAPAVSRHLRILEAAGLIERARKGTFHGIALNLAPLESVKEFIGALELGAPVPKSTARRSGDAPGKRVKPKPQPGTRPERQPEQDPEPLVWDPEEDEIAKLL